MSKSAVITGITGQDGAYLAQLLLEKKYNVTGILSNKRQYNLWRLEYLGITKNINYEVVDLEDLQACNRLLHNYFPDELYNLAAQSSVAESFTSPVETISYNVFSVLNLLEAIRLFSPGTRMYQAGSSEMFGLVNKLPITPDSVIHPVSPYGISKATGHLLVNQYRHSYGLFAVGGILFNHESYLRSETFFIKKVIRTALRISTGKEKVLRVGNIEVKRDFGYAKEYVKAIWNIMQLNEPGDFVVCSGTSISLREIVYYVFDKFGINHDKIIQDPALHRPSEIPNLYGDNSDVKDKTGWKYEMTFFDVVDILIEEELANTSQYDNR